MGDLRITGLATGLDVDSMVKTMMKAENMRVDKLKQSRQMVQWKQDLYREILGDINTFKSTYFDVLKSDSYMLSSNSYSAFDVNSSDSDSNTATPTATATAGVGAAVGTYSIVVNQMAKAATIDGTSLTNNQATVSATPYINNADWSNMKIVFDVEGTTAEITLPDYGTDLITMDTLVNDINGLISGNSTLSGKISISKVGTANIQFNTITKNTVKVNSQTTAVFTGLAKDKVINPTKDTKLSNLGISGSTTFNLTYNGTTKPITINSTDTVSSFINSISTATSGNVIAKYSEITGNFSFQTLNTGGSNSISISGTIPELGINTLSRQGQDSQVSITPPGGNATLLTKSTNSFTVDGMTYNLQGEDISKTTKITVTSNTQKTFDKIKAFIDKYNETISKIQTEIQEKKQYNFKPLTDEQKKDMKEDEIKKWEDKAKEGLLKSDSMLQNMLYSMRAAFFDSVEGAGISLKDIGLATDSDYTQGGKVIIDEAKLKDAIKNRGEQVMKLFSQDSSKSYDPDHKTDKDRYKNIGIFQRINDILKDYTRTTRASNGKKGLLIETAGIKGDLSEFENTLTKQLTKDYDKRIDALVDLLADKENRYYQQFSKLETAMNQLNSQSNWLAQQLGTGGNS